MGKIVTNLEVNLSDNISPKTGRLKQNLISTGKAISAALSTPQKAVDIGSIFKFDPADNPVEKINKIIDTVNAVEAQLSSKKGKTSQNMMKALGVDNLEAGRAKLQTFAESAKAALRIDLTSDFKKKIEEFSKITDFSKAKKSAEALKASLADLQKVGALPATAGGTATAAAWSRAINGALKDIEGGKDVSNRKLLAAEVDLQKGLTKTAKAGQIARLNAEIAAVSKEIELRDKAADKAKGFIKTIERDMLAGKKISEADAKQLEISNQAFAVAGEEGAALIQQREQLKARLAAVESAQVVERVKIDRQGAVAVEKVEKETGEKKVRARKQTAEKLRAVDKSVPPVTAVVAAAKPEATTETAAAAATDERLTAAKKLSQAILVVEGQTSKATIALAKQTVRAVVEQYKQAITQIEKILPTSGRTATVILKFKTQASPLMDFSVGLAYINERLKLLDQSHDLVVKFGGLKDLGKKVEEEFKKVGGKTGKDSPLAQMYEDFVGRVQEGAAELAALDQKNLAASEKSFKLQDGTARGYYTSLEKYKNADLATLRKALATKEKLLADSLAKDLADQQRIAQEKRKYEQQKYGTVTTPAVSVAKPSANSQIYETERQAVAELISEKEKLTEVEAQLLEQYKVNEAVAKKSAARQSGDREALATSRAEISKLIAQVRRDGRAAAAELGKAAANFDKGFDLAGTKKLSGTRKELTEVKRQLTALRGQADAFDVVIKFLAQASAPVPFSEGIRNMEKKIDGLGKKEETVKVKFVSDAPGVPKSLSDGLSYLGDMVEHLGREVTLSMKVDDTQGLQVAKKHLVGYEAELKKIASKTGDAIWGLEKKNGGGSFTKQISDLKVFEAQIKNIQSKASGLGWSIAKALGQFKMPKTLGDYAKEAKDYLARGPIERDLIFNAKIRKSPPVPFSQGIEDIKKAFNTIPMSRDLEIQVKTTEGAVGAVDEALTKKLEAEQRVAAAQKAVSEATDKASRKEAKRELDNAKNQEKRWTATYNARLKTAQEMYNKLEGMANEEFRLASSNAAKLISTERADQLRRIEQALANDQKGIHQRLAAARDEWAMRKAIEVQAYKEMEVAANNFAALRSKDESGQTVGTEEQIQAARQVYQEKARYYYEEKRLLNDSLDAMLNVANQEIGVVEATTGKQRNVRARERRAEQALLKQYERDFSAAERQNTAALEKEEDKRVQIVKAATARKKGTAQAITPSERDAQMEQMWKQANAARILSAKETEEEIANIMIGNQSEFFAWRTKKDQESLSRFLKNKAAERRAEEERGAAEVAIMRRTEAAEKARDARIGKDLSAYQANETGKTRAFASEEQKRTDISKTEAEKRAEIDAAWKSQQRPQTQVEEETERGFSKMEAQRSIEARKAAEEEVVVKRKTNAQIIGYERLKASELQKIDNQIADSRRKSLEKQDNDTKKSAKDQLNSQRGALAETMRMVRDELKKLSDLKRTAADKLDQPTYFKVSGIKNQIEPLYRELGTAYAKIMQALRTADKDAGDRAIADAEATAAKIRAIIGGATGGVGTPVPPLPPDDIAKGWEDRLTSLSYRFTHAGMMVSGLGMMMKEAFTTPISAATELQKEIGFTNAVMKGGEEGMRRMREAAVEMSQKTIFSSMEAAQGMKTLSVAGLNAKETFAVLPTVLQFASAGMMNVDDAAQTLISTVTSFGLKLRDFPTVANTIAAAANATNTTMQKMAHAFSIVGPAAHQLGLSVEQTAVQIGLLSKAGIESGPAATQLSGLYRVLGQLATGTASKGVQKSFDAMGISLVNANDEFVGMEETVKRFSASLAGMTHLEKLGKITEIFKTRSGPRALLAMMEQTEVAAKTGGSAFEDLTNKIRNFATIEEIALARTQDLYGSMTMLKNSFISLQQSLGFAAEGGPLSYLIMSLTWLINKITDFINYVPGVKMAVSVFMALAAVGVAITATAGAVTLLASTLLSAAGVRGPVLELKNVITTMIAEMKRGVGASAALKAGLDGVRAAADGAGNEMRELGVAARNVPTTPGGGVGGVGGGIGGGFFGGGAGFGKVGAAMAGVVSKIGSAFGKLGPIGAKIFAFGGVLTKLVTGPGKLLLKFFGPIGLLFEGLNIALRFTEARKGLSKISDGMKDAAEGIKAIKEQGGDETKIPLLEGYSKQLDDLRGKLKTQELIAAIPIVGSFISNKDEVLKEIEDVTKKIGQETIEIAPKIDMGMSEEARQKLNDTYTKMKGDYENALRKMMEMSEKFAADRVDLEKLTNIKLAAEDVIASDQMKQRKRIQQIEQYAAELEALADKEDAKSVKRRETLVGKLKAIGADFRAAQINEAKAILDERKKVEQELAEIDMRIQHRNEGAAATNAGRSATDYDQQREAATRRIAYAEQDIAKIRKEQSTAKDDKERAAAAAKMQAASRRLTEAQAALSGYKEKEADSAQKVADASERTLDNAERQNEEDEKKRAELLKKKEELDQKVTAAEGSATFVQAMEIWKKAQEDALEAGKKAGETIAEIDKQGTAALNKALKAVDTYHNVALRRQANIVQKSYGIWSKWTKRFADLFPDFQRDVEQAQSEIGVPDELENQMENTGQSLNELANPGGKPRVAEVQPTVVEPSKGGPATSQTWADIVSGKTKVTDLGVQVVDQTDPNKLSPVTKVVVDAANKGLTSSEAAKLGVAVVDQTDPSKNKKIEEIFATRDKPASFKYDLQMVTPSTAKNDLIEKYLDLKKKGMTEELKKVGEELAKLGVDATHIYTNIGEAGKKSADAASLTTKEWLAKTNADIADALAKIPAVTDKTAAGKMTASADIIAAEQKRVLEEKAAAEKKAADESNAFQARLAQAAADERKRQYEEAFREKQKLLTLTEQQVQAEVAWRGTDTNIEVIRERLSAANGLAAAEEKVAAARDKWKQSMSDVDKAKQGLPWEVTPESAKQEGTTVGAAAAEGVKEGYSFGDEITFGPAVETAAVDTGKKIGEKQGEAAGVGFWTKFAAMFSGPSTEQMYGAAATAGSEVGTKIGDGAAAKTTEILATQISTGGGGSIYNAAATAGYETGTKMGEAAGAAAVTAIDAALANKTFKAKVQVDTSTSTDLGLPGARLGGLIRFLAGGGHLPGYGGGDRRLALLEDGEYVLPKEAVRGIGVDTLHRLRAFFAKGIGTPSMSVGIPRFAAGGVVGRSAGSLGSYDVNITVGGKKFTFQTGKQDLASQFAAALRREELTTV